ncbi:site-specific DNA-methyltransferase [Paenibacillus urinalis]|uniref:Site-specific DNA-methyltransferase n=1 Tax=Paenibacillus urinalis TaxID=521520 RepID=A0ABY7XE13_9BACL|nr:site-specific DNA-methyltransferase [Paenibacillus urinalis]WDH95757.1 site-specific DNA-methyltransferase [Paenibacillus urinalis]WDI03954.1 site-specific DNA-methyltransferase [Paenibacillus urinalis]
MEYTKVSKEIFDPIKMNKAKFEEMFSEQLAELFPSSVKDGVVDFASLLSHLGQYIDSEERYEINWAGKADSMRIANSDIVGKTLKYILEDSKDPELTENTYIEGDNLEVLKLLRNSYYNKIKMIYIDPPYNTGNDFVYKDDFSISSKENEKAEGDVDEDYNRLIANQRSNGKYHSNWLSMIYPRLRIAKDLLSEDGVIFISIDDNEVVNLRKVCDSVFGEENFFAQVIVQSNKRGQTYKQISKTHEYLLIYTKNPDVEINELEKSGETDDLNQEDNIGRFNTRELRNRNPKFGKFNRPNLHYPIYVNGRVVDKDGFSPISLVRDNDYSIEVLPINSTGGDSCWRWGKALLESNINSDTLSSNVVAKRKNDGGYNIYEKYRKSTYKPKSIWQETDFITEKGTVELGKLGLSKFFDFPKPTALIKQIVQIGTDKDSIVLDFFSGSATTAEAVMRVNAEDGGNRKYIMVQLDEKFDVSSEAFVNGYRTICDVGKERIRRAGTALRDEFQNAELDTGFRVFKLSNTNIRWFSEAIKSDILDYDMTMTDKDKLDFNPGFTDLDVVYEILLRHRDIQLSTNVEHLSDIGSRTYIFADTVVVCLEETISEEMINMIAAIEPMPTKIIFRDSAFGDDISLKENTMSRLEAQMRKNSGLEKRAYRVEFI